MSEATGKKYATTSAPSLGYPYGHWYHTGDASNDSGRWMGAPH